MNSKTYAMNLEKKLIDEFKSKFQEKMGYVPTVITKVSADGMDNVPMMSLDDLSSYFDPFLPVLYNKKLTLKCRSRKRELVELRNIFCAIARMMRFTCTSIGDYLGNRDHTTVLHNVVTFKNLIETSEVFREKYLLILNHIKQNYESSALDEFDQEQCESQLSLLS